MAAARHRVAAIAPYPGAGEQLGLLPQGIQNWLIHNFTSAWQFATPVFSSLNPARPYQQGRWLPAPKSHDHIPLASGGSGIVHVWVCVDHNNNITDRVVVKQGFPGAHWYNNPDCWVNGAVGGEPLEHSIANAVHAWLRTNSPGQEKYINECLGYGDVTSLPPNLHQFKLYYEYLLGDLPKCIESQWPTSKMRKRPGRLTRQRVEIEQKPFPEGFLWALGDFGSSRYTDAQGQVNRYGMGPHADAFASPEQNFDKTDWPGFHTVHFFNHWDPTLPPSAPGMRPGGYVPRPATITCKTNIWQIGMLMLSALRLEPELLETQWRWRHHDPAYPIPQHQAMGFEPGFAYQPMKMRLGDHESQRYSRQLLTLVRKCIRVDPEARISPQQLLQEVRIKMVGRDGGMMTATGKFPWNHPQAIRMSLGDKYKVGKKPYVPRRVT
ncbi:hypothetical protein E4T48_01542 [Aureobasidium sp. EXF-10727]|nr:hypothetical protein E4T48_01542 [Aureobasidium sp. EXF-10727]